MRSYTDNNPLYPLQSFRDMTGVEVYLASGSRIYDKSSIARMVLRESVSTNRDYILPGVAACASIEITLKCRLEDGFIGYDCNPSITYGNTTIVLGQFVITDVDNRPGSAQSVIYADDLMSVYDVDYSGIPAGLTDEDYPTYQQLLDDIVPLTAANWETVPVVSAEQVALTVKQLHAYKEREIIAYIAGAHGMFAQRTNTRKMRFRWYQSNGLTVPKTAIYLDGLTRKTLGDVQQVTDIYCADDVQDTGFGTYTNDLISSAYAAAATDPTITASPGELRYRGHPAIEAGDIIGVTCRDGSVIHMAVSEHTLTFAGGLVGEISSHGLQYHASSALTGTERDIIRLQSQIAHL